MFFNLRSEATIYNPVEFSGIGVHSGKHVNMTVCPAGIGSGIVFERTDIKDKDPFVKLSPDSVIDPTLCTRVVNKSGVFVAVVEHLLAALRICGITNALVKIDSHEVPIMDGSALDFVAKFKQSGIIRQDAFVPAIVISRSVVVESENGKIELTPSDYSNISVKISYDRINPVIGENNSHSFSFEDNLMDIAESRTFGWVEDYDKIRNMGLALGTSAANTVAILPDHTIKNEGGLRNPKELVKHKCLDLIGDILVIGYDIVGNIDGFNTSHSLNNKLMRKLLAEISKHKVVTNQISEEYNKSLSFI